MTVAAILKHKGHDVARVAPTALIAAVARTLSDLRIGAVLVMDSAEQLLGILSERDIVQGLAKHGPVALDMTAAQLMTQSPTTATETTTVCEAMATMTSGRFRHLPVMSGGRVTGVVSIGDIVKARITQQEHEVDTLKAYVAGS